MEELFNASWRSFVADEFQKPYFEQLTSFVKEEYQNHACFPPEPSIFAAFDACEWENLKVVIIGQDPYPTRGHANGLCFSINPDVRPFAKSLTNIFKEIEGDLGIPIPENGDLFRWAKQGVLLLNTILTVREGSPQSHQNKGWEQFTDAVISIISEQKENVVFLLWGGNAKSKAKLINKNNHYLLESGHPSPMSANRGYWFGNKHFSKTNQFLESKGMTPIQW